MTHFHFVTPAYNCAEKIEQTLWSVFGQTYKNWSMTIIDDVSTDDTSNVVKHFVEKHGFSDRVNIVRREEKYGEVRNTVDICSALDPDFVVVRLDAGDWLTDLGCLEALSVGYEAHNPAVLWTAHRWSWSGKNISGPINPNVSVYDQPWTSSHLKTFRVRDFIGLNPKNFLDDDGKFIMIACDQAVFLPMLERARRNGRPLVYCPSVFYHYDIDVDRGKEIFHTPRAKKQKASAQWIRSRGYIDEDSV